ncbi:hypothetical protein BH20ACI3_BH20ACI3_11050 [soil metagenome]
MSLENRRLIGFEALARWRHPEFGLVSPLDFIDWGVRAKIGP